MRFRITRSISDDSLYTVTDGNRTRPMRSGELTRWLRWAGVSELDLDAILNLPPATSTEVNIVEGEQPPGRTARAS